MKHHIYVSIYELLCSFCVHHCKAVVSVMWQVALAAYKYIHCCLCPFGRVAVSWRMW